MFFNCCLISGIIQWINLQHCFAATVVAKLKNISVLQFKGIRGTKKKGISIRRITRTFLEVSGSGILGINCIKMNCGAQTFVSRIGSFSTISFVTTLVPQFGTFRYLNVAF